MSVAGCEYCDGVAEMNVGELWLCQPHARVLEEYVGGLPPLLEMAPAARRAVADVVLVRVMREEVVEPSDVPGL